jgi:hypothetical protein
VSARAAWGRISRSDQEGNKAVTGDLTLGASAVLSSVLPCFRMDIVATSKKLAAPEFQNGRLLSPFWRWHGIAD